MNKLNLYVVFLLVFGLGMIFSCGDSRSSTSDLIEFDLAKNYPKKTLDIHDVADVEYLVLKTQDSLLFTNFSYLTDNYIIAFNYYELNYVFFDRKGNPISNVARAGQGPEEYTAFFLQVYDEIKDDFFVFSYPDKIQVYNKNGIYKRTLSLRGTTKEAFIDAFYNWNEDFLLCHDKQTVDSRPFYLLSKKDGSVKDIPLAFSKKVNTSVVKKDASGEFLRIQYPFSYAIKKGENILLTEYSNDTFFLYTPNFELIPKFIRKPSIQQTDPPVLIHALLDAGSYTFFALDELYYNFNTREGGDEKGFMIDNQSHLIYEVDMLNRDYKKQDLFISPATITSRIGECSSNPATGVRAIKTDELIKARDDGKLSGTLKAVVDTMDESTPFVLMIMNFK